MFNLFKKNVKTIFLFEMFYLALFFIIGEPIINLLCNLSFKAAGISYLAMDTLGTYFLSPLSLLCLIIVTLFFSYCVFVEISAMIIALDYSHQDKKISLMELFGAAFSNSLRIFKPKNLLLIVYILLFLPLMSVISFSSITYSLSIPGFIQDFIKANTTLLIIVSVVLLIFFILLLKSILSFQYFTIEKENFINSIKKSSKLLKKKKIRILFSIAIKTILVAIIHIAASTILALLFYFIYGAITKSKDERSFIISFTVIFTILSTLIVPLNFSIISDKFYKYSEEKNIEYKRNYNHPIMKRSIAVVLLVVCVIGLILSTIFEKDIPALKTNMFDNDVIVIAHRGYSQNAPENNMPAFQKAIDVNCPMIELDVHQTKDGVVVVTHDANINRIAKVDKNVYDLTFDELEKYDVGSWFSNEYKGLKVATLDQVIKLCKENNTTLQIELKPTGHEENFEENVIKVVRDNKFENMCFLASLKADCIQKCKKLAPDIPTLYIMAIAIGDLTPIDYANAFSIEESNVDEELVNQSHSVNKPIYVWTINDKDSVEDLISQNIDGILTDNVEEIQEEVDKINNTKSNLLMDFFSNELRKIL